MKKIFIPCLLFLLSCLSQPTDLAGKAVSIADGDSFTLLDERQKQVKIRLHGIDCPERGQDFGTAARKRLSTLIFGKQLRIEKKDEDRYRRMVAVVYAGSTQSVNEIMLAEGYAWHYKQYDQNPDWDRLERAARQKKA